MKRYNIATHPVLGQMRCDSKAVRCSNHASMKAMERGILIPASITINAGDVVECEAEGKTLTKLVVRKGIPKTEQDVVLVLVPKDTEWLVVTCWTNHKNDKHTTLDTTRLSL